MVHWYQNNTYPKARKAGRPVPSSPKKPRGIGGIDVFEQRYRIDVNKKAEDVRKMEGISSQSSVNIYKRALRDMYQDADPDVKESCEEDAKTVNNSRQEKPPTSEIYS
jgi:hypothetical protein